MNLVRKEWMSSPALRYALGVLALLVLVVLVDVGSVIASLSQVTLQDLFLILLISALLIWVSVLKWQLFLVELGIKASCWHLSRLYLLGYFVNLLMPSYIGGDLARSISVGKGADQASAFSATFLERYTGLVAMVFMALVGVCFTSAVTPQIRVATVCVAVALCVGSVVTFLGYGSKVAAALRCPQRVLEFVRKIEVGLKRGVTTKRVVLRAAALSMFFHLLTVVNTAAVGFAVGWTQIPWLELTVVVPLILLVGAIPISPQGLGIQEGAFLYFLGAVGASEPQALAIGIILRAKSYLLALLGGGVWFSSRSRAQAVDNVYSPGAD
jgi:uncharacterized protein (TIRG00374 family)